MTYNIDTTTPTTTGATRYQVVPTPARHAPICNAIQGTPAWGTPNALQLCAMTPMAPETRGVNKSTYLARRVQRVVWDSPRFSKYMFTQAEQYRACRALYKYVGTQCRAAFKAWRHDQRFAGVALHHAISMAVAQGANTDVRFARLPTEAIAIALSARAELSPPANATPDENALVPTRIARYCGLHVSKTDPEKTCSYPTRGDALRPREIILAPGKFAVQTDMFASDEEVKQFAARWRGAYGAVEIQWVEDNDPDGWRDVYTHCAPGAQSCMSNGGVCRDWRTEDEDLPVVTYAYPGNGLRLAYLRTKEGVRARTIVNEPRKQYVRVYGDDRLARMLESAGYTHDITCLGEVKIARIPHPIHRGHVLVPYVDGREFELRDDGYWLTIAPDGDYAGSTTSGRSEDTDHTLCDDCGEQIRGGIEGGNATSVGVDGDHTVCEGCLSGYTYAVVGTYRGRAGDCAYLPDEDVLWIDGDAYDNNPEMLRELNFVEGENGRWYHIEDVEYLDYADEYVARNDVVALDRDFGYDSYARYEDTMVVTIAGERYTVHEDWEGLHDALIARTLLKARAKVEGRCAKFSRGPGQRSRKTQRNNRSRYVQRAYRALVAKYA